MGDPESPCSSLELIKPCWNKRCYTFTYVLHKMGREKLDIKIENCLYLWNNPVYTNMIHMSLHLTIVWQVVWKVPTELEFRRHFLLLENFSRKVMRTHNQIIFFCEELKFMKEIVWNTGSHRVRTQSACFSLVFLFYLCINTDWMNTVLLMEIIRIC